MIEILVSSPYNQDADVLISLQEVHCLCFSLHFASFFLPRKRTYLFAEHLAAHCTAGRTACRIHCMFDV